MYISGMREGDSMEKSEERNKIISELQTVIKEQVELKEIEIPGTITFQVVSVDGGNVPVALNLADNADAKMVGMYRWEPVKCFCFVTVRLIWNTVMSWKTRTRSFIWQFISFIVKSRKVYLVK